MILLCSIDPAEQGAQALCLLTITVNTFPWENNMRILVAEDERDLNTLIVEKLRSEDYAIDTCYDGGSALEYLTLTHYDGAIMDIALPVKSGYDVLHEMHAQRIFIPVMFLSSETAVDDIVRGLDEGADDYLIKPFDLEVLSARLRVMLRKTVGVHDNIYRCGDLEVDVSRQEVFRAGQRIGLTGREFAILLYFIRNQNVVIPREQILSGVWNDDGEITSNVVDVYIRYLRRKVDDPFEYKMIQTVRGVGYCLKSEH